MESWALFYVIDFIMFKKSHEESFWVTFAKGWFESNVIVMRKAGKNMLQKK